MHPLVQCVTELATSKKKTVWLLVLLVGCVLSERGTAAFNEPTVHAPRDWWMNIKTTHPGAILSTTNPTRTALILTQTSSVRNQLPVTRVMAHTRPVALSYEYFSADSRGGAVSTRQMGLWSTAPRIPISGGISQVIVQVYTTSEIQCLLSRVYKISRLGKALSVTDCSAKWWVENGQHKNIHNCFFS